MLIISWTLHTELPCLGKSFIDEVTLSGGHLPSTLSPTPTCGVHPIWAVDGFSNIEVLLALFLISEFISFHELALLLTCDCCTSSSLLPFFHIPINTNDNKPTYLWGFNYYHCLSVMALSLLLTVQPFSALLNKLLYLLQYIYLALCSSIHSYQYYPPLGKPNTTPKVYHHNTFSFLPVSICYYQLWVGGPKVEWSLILL